MASSYRQIRGITRRVLFTYCLLVFSWASAQKVEVDLNAIKQVVTKWNDAHNVGRGSFNELYANSVLFYGRSLAKKECINRKVSLLEGSQFSQELSSDLQLSVYEGGIIYCAFTKSVSQDGTIKRYPSYLLLRKSGNRYLIEGEGDLITDRNLKFQLSLGIQVPLAELEVIPQAGPSDKVSISILSKNELSYWMTVVVAPLAAVACLLAFIFIRKRFKNSPKPKGANMGQMPLEIDVRNSSLKKQEATNTNSYGDELLKGKTFEQFVIDRFRSKSDFFKWKDATSDRGTRDYHPESNEYPDLQYEFHLSGRIHPFAIECKYRSMNHGPIKVVKDDLQLERYKRFSRDKKMDVYVVLGLGGNPGAPSELYVIPLSDVSPWMEHRHLSEYRTFRRNFSFDPETQKLS